MDKIFQKILCLVWFHDWGYGYSTMSGAYETCSRPGCTKSRLIKKSCKKSK